jgi:hypothetical protein
LLFSGDGTRLHPAGGRFDRRIRLPGIYIGLNKQIFLLC